MITWDTTLARFLPLLLILLGASAAQAQPKPAPEVPPGKAPPPAHVAPLAGAVPPPAEPVAPAAKPPEPVVAPPPVPVKPTLPVPPLPANGLVLAPAAPHGDTPFPTSARVAITDFKVTGEETSRTLAMRLQDGFVVGLNRAAPIYVLDSVDVARYMDVYPELQKCEGSICVKRLGQVLDVSHVLRVTVAVTGNSYDMTAKLFKTEGQSPVDVPVDAQTRFCPVCTVDEARQKIIQLGEAIKSPVEVWLAQQRPPPPPPPPPPSWRRPLAATGIALGFATIVGGGALLANASGNSKKWPALGGIMIGMGASLAALSGYVLIVMPGDSPKAPPKIAIAGRF